MDFVPLWPCTSALISELPLCWPVQVLLLCMLSPAALLRATLWQVAGIGDSGYSHFSTDILNLAEVYFGLRNYVGTPLKSAKFASILFS